MKVFFRQKHFVVSLIDGIDGTALVSASSADSGMRKRPGSGFSSLNAATVGASLARKAKNAGIQEVVLVLRPKTERKRELLRALVHAARGAGLEINELGTRPVRKIGNVSSNIPFLANDPDRKPR